MVANRRLAMVAVPVLVWYACVVVLWALQPLSDSVPVGFDNTLKTPANVSVSVDCNTLFDSASRDSSPLRVLKPQPAGKAPLKFQREPCVVPHREARIVFALDTLLFIAVLGCVAWFAVRMRRSSETGVQRDTALVGAGSA